uniref:Uncharacterized protein n=1 Tax=Tanacetum cinerariifolium TaxID=118510 RepID=A0A6L2L030_TANCI|nr:hypothetical protein [Tanacetum cinerariifolium]
MHKAFPLPVIEFPLPEEVPTASEESSHCQKKRDATAVKIALLLKSRRNCQSKSYDSFTNTFTSNTQSEMDQQNPTLAKIPILDTGKFEQWQFRIQKYLQREHYALWEVIEFGDSYEVPANAATIGTASDGTGKKKGMTVTVTADDMQKRKNDVKARTTLLLSLPDEHQLRFSSETLEQMFNRLQVIVSQLQSMDVEIEQDDLNQKSDLDTMTLDDLYNYLKVYESKVQKKSETNSQNMDFISSAKHSRGNEDFNTASVSTASTNVPTAGANIGVIDKDDMEEMDIKWNMALLSMRADRARRSQDRGRRDNYRQGSKVEEQASKALMAIDGVGWDWSYMANDEENHALIADKEAPTEFVLMAKTNAESKVFDNSLCSKDWLAQVESRLAEHRDRELKYCKKIKDKNMKGLGYSDVPPPPAQIYSPPKKDMSWTGLPEFKDDTVTDYSRPAPTVESSPDDA